MCSKKNLLCKKKFVVATSLFLAIVVNEKLEKKMCVKKMFPGKKKYKLHLILIIP